MQPGALIVSGDAGGLPVAIVRAAVAAGWSMRAVDRREPHAATRHATRPAVTWHLALRPAPPRTAHSDRTRCRPLRVNPVRAGDVACVCTGAPFAKVAHDACPPAGAAILVNGSRRSVSSGGKPEVEVFSGDGPDGESVHAAPVVGNPWSDYDTSPPRSHGADFTVRF